MHGCDGSGGFLLSAVPVLVGPGAPVAIPSTGARGGGRDRQATYLTGRAAMAGAARPAMGTRSPGAVKDDGDL